MASTQCDEARKAQLERIKRLVTQIEEARARNAKLHAIKASVVQNLTDPVLRQKYQDNFTWRDIRMSQLKNSLPLGVEIPPPATFTPRERMEIEAAFHRSGVWMRKSELPAMPGQLRHAMVMEARDACLASAKRYIDRLEEFHALLIKLYQLREKNSELVDGALRSMDCFQNETDAKMKVLAMKTSKLILQKTPALLEAHEPIMEMLNEEEEKLNNEIEAVKLTISRYEMCKSDEYDQILEKFIRYKEKLELYGEMKSKRSK